MIIGMGSTEQPSAPADLVRVSDFTPDQFREKFKLYIKRELTNAQTVTSALLAQAKHIDLQNRQAAIEAMKSSYGEYMRQVASLTGTSREEYLARFRADGYREYLFTDPEDNVVKICTLEGVNTVTEGGLLAMGGTGDLYPISPETSQRTKRKEGEVAVDGWASYKTITPVYMLQIDRSFHTERVTKKKDSVTGNEIEIVEYLEGKPGDYFAFDGKREFILAQELLAQRYEPFIEPSAN